jgi:hypothetical protein
MLLLRPTLDGGSVSMNRTRLPSALTAFLFALVSSACDGVADGLSRTPLRTDSAGITVVQYAALERWNADVALTEVLRLGVVDGADELLFSSIPGGLIRPDGSVVLADAGTREVRRFAADGSYLGRHGREGKGPGEYEYIIGMGRCAPMGFTVFDIGWTLSLYDQDGGFMEERPTRLERGSTPYNLACERSGRVAAIDWNLDGRPAGPILGFHVSTARLRIVDPDGRELADLGERIGSERFGLPSGSGPHPAGRSTVFGFQDSDLIVADGTFFGFERWDPDGRLTEIVRIDVPPPDSDSLMAAYLHEAMTRARDDETRRRWRRFVEEMGTGPERASYVSALHVSADRILVREPVVGRSGRWFEFRPDGTPLGFLPLPEGSELLDVSGDLVLVEVRGELDVPAAVLYRLEPGG